MNEFDFLQLITPDDALQTLGAWIRSERQRLQWTQADLARRSNVPASTISRLERTGLASTDILMKVLFALNRLDEMNRFLDERLRFAQLPRSLHEDTPPKQSKTILRMRKRTRTDK